MSLISLTLSTNKIEKMNIKKIVRSLYEKDKNILSFDNLDVVPDQDGFFFPVQGFIALRNEIISDSEYERVRKFCNLLQLRKLELN